MGEQQSAARPELNDGDCYGFERNSAGDFPFYRQPPNALSGRSWVLILLGVVLGFAVLTAHRGFYKTTVGGFVPAILDRGLISEVRIIDDAVAYQTKRRLAREEGLLVGISAGAAVCVALDLAATLGDGAVVVTVLCDTGERYFSMDESFA